MRTTHIKPFGRLSHDQTQQLLQQAISHTYQRGQTIYTPYEVITKTTYVVKGRLKLVRNLSDGREMLIRRVVAGDSLGEVVTRTGAHYPGWLLAETAVELLEIPHRTIIELCQDSDFLYAYLDGIAERTRYLVSRLTLLSIQPLDRRLAHYLLEGDADSKEYETVTKLALILGCTRETLSRSLHSLAEDGTIVLGNNRITIKDRSRLESAIDQ